MSTEKPAELTEAEREALFKAGDHHPDQCDCTAFADEVGYASGSEICDALADTYDIVERIKAVARREALLEAADAMESADAEDVRHAGALGAPKGWADVSLMHHMEAASLWGPWLRDRAEEKA